MFLFGSVLIFLPWITHHVPSRHYRKDARLMMGHCGRCISKKQRLLNEAAKKKKPKRSIRQLILCGFRRCIVLVPMVELGTYSACPWLNPWTIVLAPKVLFDQLLLDNRYHCKDFELDMFGEEISLPLATINPTTNFECK